MLHVLVETNWVFGFAAPAHHKDPKAVELFEKARRGELRLHLPSLCLTEVRNPLRTRCQPRNEAGAIREFLIWSRDSSMVTPADYQTTDRLLNRFDASVRSELARLPQTLDALRTEPNLEVFALNEAMLEMAVELAFMDLSLQPFDQSVLAAVLVRARELWDTGERELCFCELDKDLQPWEKDFKRKLPLADLYERAGVWVFGNFERTEPVRPLGWPLNQTPAQQSI
jgi:hypothetical protein